MNHTIDIRRATLADAEVIAEFNAALAAETEDKTLDRSTLAAGVRSVLEDSSKGTYFVACIDGSPVGQLMITYEWSDWRNGWFWWIQSVYVAAAHRRKGVFRALFDHVADQARSAADVIGLRLYMEEANHAARATYRSLGMKETTYRVLEKHPL